MKRPMPIRIIINVFLSIIFLISVIAPSVSAQSVSQDDQNSIYGDSVWYKAGSDNTGSGSFSGCTVGGGGGAITLDQFLQALAYNESGGDPTASNPSGASGKYQYLTQTWHDDASVYYPPAAKYPTAASAPEAYQDAVAYIEYAVVAIKDKGNVAAMAVHNIYPAVENDPSVWSTYKIGNNPTAQQYADDVINVIQSGKASSIPMKEKQAPQFQQYLAKAGKIPTLSVTGASCTCQQAIISTAKTYAWPVYHPPVYIKKTAAYEAAVTKALNNGEYVGPTDEPYLGVDCGAFVTRVMRDSKADPTYNSGNCNTICQESYMDQHPEKYQKLGPQSSTTNLQPGDIAINSDHTYLYLGDQGFPGYDSASASFSSTGLSWRAPMASSAFFSENGSPFIWYRLKCPAAK